jgi:hypothetical protein
MTNQLQITGLKISLRNRANPEKSGFLHEGQFCVLKAQQLISKVVQKSSNFAGKILIEISG